MIDKNHYQNWVDPSSVSGMAVAVSQHLAIDNVEAIEKTADTKNTLLLALTDEATVEVSSHVSSDQLKDFRENVGQEIKVARLPNSGRSAEEIEMLLAQCAETYAEVQLVMVNPTEQHGAVRIAAMNTKTETMPLGRMTGFVNSSHTRYTIV